MFSNKSVIGETWFAVNGPRIGWKSKWDQVRYLESLDQEIQHDVLDLNTAQPSVFNPLLPSSYPDCQETKTYC